VRGNCLGHCARVRRPRVALGRKAPLRECDQVGVGPARVEAREALGEVTGFGALQHRARGRPGVRRVPRQQHREHAAEREHVGPLVHLVPRAAGLFGRHVLRRAHRHAGARFVGRAVGGTLGERRGHFAEHFRQAPVHDLHFAERAHHDVRGLQVAVNHAGPVRVADREAHLLEGAQAVFERRVVGELRRERAPANEFHGEKRAAVRQFAGAVDGRNAGVLEPGRDARLFDEPGRGAGAGVLRAQRLQRHLAPEFGVGRREHDAHAACAQFATNYESGQRAVRSRGTRRAGGARHRELVGGRVGRSRGARGVGHRARRFRGVGACVRAGAAGILTRPPARGQKNSATEPLPSRAAGVR
jgi:hypothetical protein